MRDPPLQRIFPESGAAGSQEVIEDDFPVSGLRKSGLLKGAPDRKPFGWETGAPQTCCFDDLGIRESVPGGPPEPFVTIQLTIVDVLGCWE